MHTPEDDLRLALRIADAVDAFTAARFRAADLRVDRKPDMTPVTDADRGAEEIVRRHLSEERPGDEVLGEEFGATGSGRRRWIVDPIDGTKNFVRGVPVWATLIALTDGDEVVVGVASAPALGRRWWAVRGGGAHTRLPDGTVERLRVSGVERLEDASLSFASAEGWRMAGLEEQWRALDRSVWRSRAYGDFWSYVLVAEGAVDLACEPHLEVYDMAALVRIVVEAGGRFTSLDGDDGPFGGSAIASNGLLHAELLHVLSPGS